MIGNGNYNDKGNDHIELYIILEKECFCNWGLAKVIIVIVVMIIVVAVVQ